MKPALACREYRELKDLHDVAMRAYIHGAKTLEESRGGGGFDHAYQAARDARTAFISAREQLEKHLTEHGCVELLEYSLLRSQAVPELAK